jgi:hypothetical protein
VSIGGQAFGFALFQFWQLPDFGNVGNSRVAHPAFFQLLLKTKAEPQIDAWVTVGIP